ncbi:hypothetical protein L226DRAFT_535264 [Lentinus tigrinus ALCF2SS1-7]|uniref:DUF2423 domain-containing protein n=1 Tax=Lentinus tigrinus ALCF2SS1-6 TaxID=1328759 RepID=A0A5C2SDL6_9APHY|nr:hypothetical protein L227DRAFT_573761 [Lentinus tigrinus ALCF2SS1-6]RPD74387.1 hypothetical protein L226DRAFT_535264 [Lentinus tigrinus ALCF2SS1-7]
MAKSTRSKVKRHFRAKKREEGVYAATEAARLQRLNMKLRALTATTAVQQEKNEDEMPVEREGEGELHDEPGADGQGPSGEQADSADAMDLDSGAGSSPADKRISTHGPRNSRREQWRLSKGLTARPKSRGMNRQGLVAAKRKSGRSHRRR